MPNTKEQFDLFSTETPEKTAVAVRAVASDQTAKSHSAASQKKHWLCLQFAQLSVDILPEYHDQPLAIVEHRGPRQIVIAHNQFAADAGILNGQPSVDAQAMLPELTLLPRDLKAEERRLDFLGRWCSQFSSWISIHRPQSIFLEVAGSEKLFGRFEHLRDEVLQGLSDLGHSANWASSPTARSAWWLSRYGFNDHIQDPAQLTSILEKLPLEAITDEPKLQRKLRGIGAQTIGDLSRLPREGLARRFGTDLILQLDQAWGRRPEPLPRISEAQKFQADVDLPLASKELSHFEQGLAQGVQKFTQWLRNHDLATMQFDCLFFHERPTPPSRLRMNLRLPSRDPAHLQRLLLQRLEKLELPDDVIMLRIASADLLPYNAPATDFFKRDSDQRGWQKLLEQWENQLGRDAVIPLCSQADHRPEMAHNQTAKRRNKLDYSPNERPLFLLKQPQKLSTPNGYPNYQGALKLIKGPERIEQGWWDDQDIRRDYYQAIQIKSGSRLWIFLDRRDQHWYLHGHFA